MKDEKKISDGAKEEIVLEKTSAERDYSDSQLNDELERLAQTFREELKKAQELSDEDFVEAYADDLGVIPEGELCECCGERRKDKSRGESYQYCSVCRENMKIYPLSINNIIVAVVLAALSVVSVVNFCKDFNGYDLMYKAEKAKNENMLNSALDYYDSVIAEFSEKGVIPRRAYLKSAEIIFNTMDGGTTSMLEVSDRIDTALSDFGKKLPMYASVVDMQTECKVLYGTMQEFYTLMNDEKYQNYDPEDAEMYEEVMTEIGSLIDKEISVVSSDKKTTTLLPANEGAVRFCQYMFAYMSANYDDAYKYMREVETLEPSYLWLYAYELGIVETQTGDIAKAKGLAAQLIALNVEDADGYSLYTSAERLSGNYEKALRWAEKGLKYNSDNAELMRLKAMALCCMGEYTQAKTVIDEAMEIQEYAVLYFTAMVVENELGNTETVNSLKAVLEEEGVVASERMNNYLSGKITAAQLFTEGTGEVE